MEFMTHRTRLLQILIFITVSALLIFRFWDYIWTGSVDFPQHYALVLRLAEFGHLPQKIDLSLGEMQIYPSLSHQFAAKAGKLLGSPLIGMQLAVLLSTIVLWAAIGWMLWSLPRPAARRSIFVLIVLLVVSGYRLHFELFDREIVGNYFYSQLIAQAVAMVAIAVALRLSQARVSRFAIYVFLIVSTLIIESIHLLPAVELLGFLGLLITIDQYPAVNRQRFRTVIWSFGLFALGALAVFKHPTFSAMRTISENNGTLPLHYIPTLYELIALALAVAIFSAVLVVRGLRLDREDPRRAYLALSYIGIFGLTLAILCFLQIAALREGQGSEYACRKYAFGLCTTLLIEFALLPVIFRRCSEEPMKSVWRARIAFVFDIFAIAFLVMTSFLANAPRHKELSLAKLVSTERELIVLNNSLVSHEVDKSNYAARLPGLNPLVDYMFSIGVFKSPRTKNAYDILRNDMLSEPLRVSNIITASGSKPYDILACRRPSSDPSLAVIDGACFARLMSRATFCQDQFHLTEGDWIDRRVLNGFGSPEARGTWTISNDATFTCKMPENAKDRPRMVRIVAHGFAPQNHVQRVAVSINGGEPHQYRFSDFDEQSIDLPVPEEGVNLQIKFSLPDAISPEALGITPDPRKLGVYVSWIKFSVDRKSN